MRRLLLLISSILIASVCLADNVSEYPVPDFAGGFVNSIHNIKMNDNSALVLDNFKVTELGYLEKVGGYSLFYADAGETIRETYGYYGLNNMRLFVIKTEDTTFPHDSANKYIGRLFDVTDSSAPARVSDEGFYIPYRSGCQAWNSSANYWNNKLYITSSNAEMVVYNGRIVYPARPYGYAQPRVTGVDSAGTLNGRQQYKYAFHDNDSGTSMLSTASYEVDVINGAVYVDNFILPWDTTGSVDYKQESLYVYRSSNDSDYYYIAQIDIDVVDTGLWDNGLANGAAVTNGWNPVAGDTVTNTSLPPGAIIMRMSNDSSFTLQDFFDGIDSLYKVRLISTIAKIDSNGILSAFTPASITLNGDDSIFDTIQQVQISFLDSTMNDSIFFKENIILIRIVADKCWDAGDDCDNVNAGWLIYESVYDPVLVQITTTIQDLEVYSEDSTTNFTYNPDLISVLDSQILFQPRDGSVHGTRMYVIGHPQDRNTVYYSDFGRGANFPRGKNLNIQSYYGDWLQRVLSHKGILYLFRQNSIFALQGLSFYQYQLTQIRADVGLTYPRGLTYFHDEVFYAEKFGLYSLADPINPVTIPIQKTIDSISDTAQNVYLVNLNNELFYGVDLDAGYDNNKTYVYSPSPSPHWRSQSFGLNDATIWDTEGTSHSYNFNRYILTINDSLFKWNYGDTTYGADSIIGIYQSKYFFDDGDWREKVIYIDIQGTGVCDSLKFTFYGDFGQDTLGTKTVVMDFQSQEKQRVRIGDGEIVTNNFSVKIQDFGAVNYMIKSYTIGYIDNWDKGKRPSS